jgi:hypothetical protein
MRRGALAFLITFALIALPVSAQTSPCRFVLGFTTLRDLVGADKVGSCLEDETFNLENGNAEQRTTGGLFVWRKIDNFTAFTDGGSTWVNGPNGLQSRLNSERFSWERDPVQTSAGQSTEPSGFTSSSPHPAPSATPTPQTAPASSSSSESPPSVTPRSTITPRPAPTSTPRGSRAVSPFGG